MFAQPREVENSPEFIKAVYRHLEGKESQFNYEQMVHTFLDFERFTKWVALIAQKTAIPGKTVLVSGCGFGGSLLAWYKAGALRIDGVEVDPEFAKMSSLRVAPCPGVAVHQVTPRGLLPFADQQYDIIESMDVIEHVESPHEYLTELHRVLKPGGLVLLVTPNSLFPVEQHLGIAGPPWLPVPVADFVFKQASKLPFLEKDRAFKYEKLTGMRTQNMTLVRLRSLAKAHGFHLELIMPQPDNPDFPLPPVTDWESRLLQHRVGRFVAPVKTLPILLHKKA